MNLKTTLIQLAQQVSPESAEMLIEQIQKNVTDVQDPIFEKFSNLITREQALKDGEIYTKTEQKILDSMNKRLVEESTKFGLSEQDVKDITTSNWDNKYYTFLSKIKNIEEKRFNGTETEKVLLERQRAEQAEKTLIDYKLSYTYKEKEISKQHEEDLTKLYLQNIIQHLNIRPGIDKSFAAEGLMANVQSRLKNMDGKLMVGMNGVRIVKSDDLTQEMYDNTSKRITPTKLIESIANDLGLIDNSKPVQPVYENPFGVNNTMNQISSVVTAKGVLQQSNTAKNIHNNLTKQLLEDMRNNKN